MLKYLIWQYRDDNNCWDYVRYWLNKEFKVPMDELPKYGILSGRERGHLSVDNYCHESGPVNGAIACKYRRGHLYHVGIVICGKILHVRSLKAGVSKDTPQQFNSAGNVKYYAHRSLR